jgi:uncharacterized glyoxalase superfamily protein PhnB
MALSLAIASDAEAGHLYNALAKGGTVQMPIATTYSRRAWAP